MKVSAITVCVIVQNTMAVDQNPESLLSALGNMSSK